MIELQNFYILLVASLFMVGCSIEGALTSISVGNRNISIPGNSAPLHGLNMSTVFSPWYVSPKYVKYMPKDRQQLVDEWIYGEKCKIEAVVNFIHDKVDKEILGIDKYSWGRSLICAYKSAMKRLLWHDWAVMTNDLKKIQSYIPVECPPHVIYEKLALKNSYVASLFRAFIQSGLCELDRADGTTIDKVFDDKRLISGLSRSMSEYINFKIKERYARRDSRVIYWFNTMQKNLCLSVFRWSRNKAEKLIALSNSDTCKSLYSIQVLIADRLEELKQEKID